MDPHSQELESTQPAESYDAALDSLPGVSAWGRCVSTSTSLDIPVTILSRNEYTFGRRKDVDIRIKNSSVSAMHCKLIHNEDGSVFVLDLSTNGTWFKGAKIGKGSRTLISNKDEIKLLRTPTEQISFVIYLSEEKDRLEGVDAVYDIREVLGTGAFAVVKRAIHRTSGQQFAVKVIEKKRFSLNHGSSRQNALMDEVKILQGLNHDNVIKIYDVFETDEHLYLVLELVTGGDLFDAIVALKGGGFPEHAARHIFKQLIEAVAYLHKMGIVHRDLKPENVLLSRKGSDHIKISDFGLSRIVGEGSFMKTMCGTPQYLAPEVLGDNLQAQGYDKAVDLWSLGVVLYILLSGTPPFPDESGKVLQQVKQGNLSFPPKAWNGISKTATDLVKRLLRVDPTHRISLEDVLKHPWFQADAAENPPTAKTPARALRDTANAGQSEGVSTTTNAAAKSPRTSPLGKVEAGGKGKRRRVEASENAPKRRAP